MGCETKSKSTVENADIRLLKKRLRKLIELEHYEIAARIRNWIIELGGNPTL